MPGVKTYDPSQVNIIIGGSIMHSWSTITVSRKNDRWNFSEGTSGESTRTKNASLLGDIIITLPQASGDNAVLSAHELAGSLLACSVIDKSGASIHIMPEGTVIKVPEAGYGDVAGDRIWTVTGEIIDPNVVGGNN